MKKIILAIVVTISISVFSQEKPALKDVLSVKVGLIGGWLSYEKVVSEKFTIDTEISYVGGFFKGGITSTKTNYAFTTVLSAEPRYYYNFNKRVAKGKRTTNNSANYFSVNLFYVPDLLTSSSVDNVVINKSFGIVPKFGLRRSLSEKINFQFAIGAGYSWGENNVKGFVPGLDLRFSYSL